MVREMHVALIGQKFMGRAHSNAYSQVRKHFDLTPRGIIESLDLRRPIYRASAYHGHFGREGQGFPWEQTDKAEALKHDAA